MHQGRSHRQIHSNAKRTGRESSPRLLANRIHGCCDEPRAIPVFLRAANRENEIPQDLRAAVGVIYFGMKFHAINPLFQVLYRRDGVVGPSSDSETRRYFNDMVAMAVPDFQVVGNVSE